MTLGLGDVGSLKGRAEVAVAIYSPRSQRVHFAESRFLANLGQTQMNVCNALYKLQRLAVR